MISSLLQTVQAGGPEAVRAAARLMSVLENHPERFAELLAAEKDAPSPRLILGITGAPGAGKSTLTDALIHHYRRRHPDRRIGVIAVDPSSPFTGGALLGDRVRMMRHATDPMVFVRSLASRGHLGGLALGVKGVLRVMAWLGMDVVFVETVGVGQSEVEVVRVADAVAVVLAPGQGDSVQLLKAGLMEIGDFIVINKADREGADELHHQVLAALQMESNTPRQVALVSAVEQKGIDTLVAQIEAHAQERAAERHAKRQTALRHDLQEALLEAARLRLQETLSRDSELQTALHRLAQGCGGDFSALLATLLNRTSSHP